MSLVDVTREFLPGSSSSSELGFVTGFRSCLVETIPKLSSASSSSTTSTSSKSLPYDRITSGRPDDTSAAALSEGGTSDNIIVLNDFEDMTSST